MIIHRCHAFENHPMSVLIETRKVSSNSTDSRLRFEREESGAIGIRYLRLDDQRAYEFGITCNTCQFWFERKSGANASISLGEVADILNGGLTMLQEPMVQTISNNLPRGDYIAMLERVVPRLVRPSGEDDYFCQEQVQLWGVDGFWGLPYHPRTEYYRSGSQLFNGHKQLFEFIVPMFPHRWLKPGVLTKYKDILRSGGQPTAVGLGFLDVKSPAVLQVKPEPTITEHWCFPSFLIDGHHKTYAAAELGAEITLLTFLAIAEGTADSSQIDTLPNLLCSTQLNVRPR
jgi:hypothetical protein